MKNRAAITNSSKNTDSSSQILECYLLASQVIHLSYILSRYQNVDPSLPLNCYVSYPWCSFRSKPLSRKVMRSLKVMKVGHHPQEGQFCQYPKVSWPFGRLNPIKTKRQCFWMRMQLLNRRFVPRKLWKTEAEASTFLEVSITLQMYPYFS